MFIELRWEEKHIFKRKTRWIISVVYTLSKNAYHVETEVREFAVLPGKKTIFWEEISSDCSTWAVHQWVCQVRLGCLPHYHACSCICCISGASFSGSPQLQSCKQQHKVRKALLDMAFYQLVSENILIPTCQDFRWTDAIPITTVDETETSLQDKLADGKGNN